MSVYVTKIEIQAVISELEMYKDNLGSFCFDAYEGAYQDGKEAAYENAIYLLKGLLK